MIYTKYPPNKIRQSLFLALCCHHPFVNVVLGTTTESHNNTTGLDIIGFIRENTGVQSYFEATQNVVVIKEFFPPQILLVVLYKFYNVCVGTASFVFLCRHFVIDKLLLMSL